MKVLKIAEVDPRVGHVHPRIGRTLNWILYKLPRSWRLRNGKYFYFNERGYLSCIKVAQDNSFQGWYYASWDELWK